MTNRNMNQLNSDGLIQRLSTEFIKVLPLVRDLTKDAEEGQRVEELVRTSTNQEEYIKWLEPLMTYRPYIQLKETKFNKGECSPILEPEKISRKVLLDYYSLCGSYEDDSYVNSLIENLVTSVDQRALEYQFHIPLSIIAVLSLLRLDDNVSINAYDSTIHGKYESHILEIPEIASIRDNFKSVVVILKKIRFGELSKALDEVQEILDMLLGIFLVLEDIYENPLVCLLVSSKPGQLGYLGPVAFYPMHRPFYLTGGHLSVNNGMRNNIDNFWKMLTCSQCKKVKVAAIRYLYAKQRGRDDDRFLDYMIACESLIGDDGGEIKYKMKMRAAWYFGQSENERREIAEDVNKSYDIRSQIVHGREYDMQELAQKAKFLMNLVRNALIKLAKEHNGESHANISKVADAKLLSGL